MLLFFEFNNQRALQANKKHYLAQYKKKFKTIKSTNKKESIIPL